MTRELVIAAIFLIQRANHFECALFGLIHHSSPYLNITVGVVRRSDADGDHRMFFQHLVLDPPARRVDDNVRPIPVKPQRRHLRRAVGQSESEMSLSLWRRARAISNPHRKIETWVRFLVKDGLV